MSVGKACLASFLLLAGLWLAGGLGYALLHSKYHTIAVTNRSGRRLAVFYRAPVPERRRQSDPVKLQEATVYLGPYESRSVGSTSYPEETWITIKDARTGVLLKTFVSTEDSKRDSNGRYVFTYRD